MKCCSSINSFVESSSLLTSGRIFSSSFSSILVSFKKPSNFIVDPEHLKNVIVEDPVAIKFVNISNVTFLGETGKKMAKAGFKFIVTRKLAEELIKNKEAIYIYKPNGILD